MRLSKFAALMCCVLLLGCSSDDSDSETQEDLGLPYIGTFRADAVHFHPSFWEKWNEPPVALKMNFEIEVSHPGTVSELDFIEVHNSIADWYWVFLGGMGNIPLSQFYSPADDVFRQNIFYANSPDRIELEGYEVVVFDRKGNRTIKQFDFPGFNGGSLNGREFVYSSDYALSTFKGVRAMEAMTIDENDLTFESDPGSQSFNIGFSHRDSRASDYFILFYGVGPAYEYLGEAKGFNSPSIASTPLVWGGNTILSLPYSEILEAVPTIENIEDIGGIHIGLHDEFIDGWSSYVGVSEFLHQPTPSEE